MGKLFARIDKDGSGQLSLQELIEGARHDSGFQSRLRVMDTHVREHYFHFITYVLRFRGRAFAGFEDVWSVRTSMSKT